MRVWIATGLIVVVGCTGKQEFTPTAKAPAKKHGEQGMPSKDGHGSHKNVKINVATHRKLVLGTDPS